jgi:hypothetical protein
MVISAACALGVRKLRSLQFMSRFYSTVFKAANLKAAEYRGSPPMRIITHANPTVRCV